TAFNRSAKTQFPLSTEWRNNNENDLACECVIGPKTSVRNPLLPLSELFLHTGWTLPSVAAIGSGGRRHGGFTNYQRTRQCESTFGFFQSFGGSVRAYSSRRSS